MVETWWRKLNRNERMAATGALIVFVVSLFGLGWIALLCSAGVLAVYWLKYAPNQTINWPAPVELITLVLSAILGISVLMSLLALISFTSLGFGLLGFAGGGLFGGVYLVAVAGVIVVAIGSGMMVLATWREYQAWSAASSPTSPAAAPPPPPPPSATDERPAPTAANDSPASPSGGPGGGAGGGPSGTSPSEPPA